MLPLLACQTPRGWRIRNDRTSQEININLKEVLSEAKTRITQHNHNENIIEGEILIDKELTDSGGVANNKADAKKDKEILNQVDNQNE